MLDASVFEKIKDKSGEFLGFSYHHRLYVDRVYRLAVRIAKEERAGLYVVRAAMLLHDACALICQIIDG